MKVTLPDSRESKIILCSYYDTENGSRGSFDPSNVYNIDWNECARDPVKEVLKIDVFLPLSKFLDFLDPKANESVASTKYKEYREAFSKKTVSDFFLKHKDQDWFKEKYHPTSSKERQEIMNARAKTTCDSFIIDLKRGDYEGLSFDDFEGSSAFVNDEQDSSQTEFPASLQRGIVNFPKNYLLLKSLSNELSRAELEASFSKVPGFVRLELCENENYASRTGYLILEESADVTRSLEVLESGDLKVNASVGKQSSKLTFAPPVSSSEDRIRFDFKLAKKLVYYLNESSGIENPFTINEEFQMRYHDVDGDISEIEVVKHALDVFILYLRRVFYVCFYNSKRFNCLEALVYDCGNACVRSKEHSNLEVEYPQKHDFVLEKLCDPAYVDPNFELKDEETHVNEFVKKSFKQEKEEKYRCILCAKLFKGEEFVSKHIRVKHESDLENEKQSVQYYNHYLKDSLRDMPSLEPVNASTIPSLANLRPPTQRHNNSGYRRPSRDSRYSGRKPSGAYIPPSNNRRVLMVYEDLDVPKGEEVELNYS